MDVLAAGALPVGAHRVVDLHRDHLGGTRLRGVRFYGARFYGARFCGARFCGARSCGAWSCGAWSCGARSHRAVGRGRGRSHVEHLGLGVEHLHALELGEQSRVGGLGRRARHHDRSQAARPTREQREPAHGELARGGEGVAAVGRRVRALG
ncbi:pentapeptide repeat-containing protein, partial [Cellulosimicrobium cellulans]|uniref:pentapeptide repeat-containing protein n=1 Tax=Cellulosimicrobium cellulans TaxID=1710 RepID=UPI00344BB355